jgi:hypothetical protein
MDVAEDRPILLRNTMQITDGHLDGFKGAVHDAVSFVEANGPQLMVEVFIDEHALRAYSFQLYQDSESIVTHWMQSDPYIREVMKHCVVRRLDLYGQPSGTVMDGTQPFSDEGVTVTVTPHFTGFVRLS